jgi:hypothetical protein
MRSKGMATVLASVAAIVTGCGSGRAAPGNEESGAGTVLFVLASMTAAAKYVAKAEGTNLAGISFPLKKDYGDVFISRSNSGNAVRASTHPDASDLLARYRRQVIPIGAGSTTRLTEPVDLRITSQTGLVWAERADGCHYLAQIYIENSIIGGIPTNPTTIRFRAFIDDILKDAALARAAPNQPRGIQTLPWSVIRGISSPLPSTAARELRPSVAGARCTAP